MDLLERDAALATLRAELVRMASDGGRVALVCGEAGIGKTSLLERFAREIDGEHRMVRGACDALSTPRPLGPLLDVLGQSGDPALAAMEPNDPNRLFTAWVAWIRSQRPGLVIVFEDVHWADQGSLDVVKLLGRRIGELHALLVLSYRDDELGGSHPLRSVLGELPPARTTRIALAPLSHDAVHRMTRASGVDIAADWLYGATGGNPFFVSEVLAAGSAALPETLRDAVLARASRLGGAARTALDFASLSPVPVEPALVDACLPDGADALDECVAQGMLATSGDRYRFRHELARLAVRDALSPARRRALSRRLFQALEAIVSAPAALARLAHHAIEAGDAAAVLKYAPAAGEAAAKAGSHREASSLFAQALAYAGTIDAPARARLLGRHALASHNAGDIEASITSRSEEARVWASLGDVERQGESLSRLTLALTVAGRNADAANAIDTAIALLEARPEGPHLALAYRTRAALCMLERDNRDAVSWGEKALAIAGRHDDRESTASTHNAIGTALILSGDEARGIRHLETSIALAKADDLDTHVANGFLNLGSGLGEVHRIDLAKAALETGLAFAQERGLETSRLYCMAWLAICHAHAGDFGRAGDLAADVPDRAGVPTISRIMALVALGRIRSRRGDAGADEALDRALALAEPTGALQRLGAVRAARAEAAWLAGDVARALDEARAAYGLAVAKAHPWFIGELAYWQWKCGAIDEPPALAAEPYRLQIEGRARDAAGHWTQRGCAYEAARALADSDDEDALREALRTFDRMGAREAAEPTRRKLRAHGVAGVPRGPRPATRANAPGLTTRELEIARLVAQGLTNAEIARRLHRSTKTIDHHVAAVLAKLDVRSRSDVAEAAARHELFPK